MVDTQYVEIPIASVTLGEDVTAKGLLMAVKSDTEAYKATDSAGMRCIGINLDEGDEGDVIAVQKKNGYLINSTGHPVTNAHIGTVCYVEGTTGYTVASSSTSHSVVAGIVEGIDADSGKVLVSTGASVAVALSS